MKYWTVGVVFCLAKWWHRTATASDVRFLLAPVDWLVGGATGSPGRWTEAGYRHADLGVVVDAGCAGFNFYLVAFLLTAFLLLRRYDRWWAVGAALLAAYPLTVAANVSRILTVLTTGDAPAGFTAGGWHEVQGAVVYLTALTGFAALLSWHLRPRPLAVNR